VDEFVGELDPAVFGDDLHQVLLDDLRGFATGEAETTGETEDVGIDDDAFRFAVCDAENDVGGLAGRSGDVEKFGHGLRNFAVELLADDAARALNRLGFVVVETCGADEGFEGFERGIAHGLWRGIGGEELGSNHVDAGVSALRREDGRN